MTVQATGVGAVNQTHNNENFAEGYDDNDIAPTEFLDMADDFFNLKMSRR